MTRRQTSRPGLWRNANSPFNVGIMDLPFRQRQIRKVFVKKAAQIGVSEALRNILACLAHQEPDPALLVLPDENSAKKIMRKRILPMFEDTPALAALKTAQAKDQALHNVTLRNGFDLGIGWSGSPSTLAADPIRFIGFDETDKFSDWNGRESDPISLGDVRTATYDNAIQYAISTPTTREGLINALHENAAIKLWFFVPCPHCGLAQRLTFGQLEWDYKEVKDARQRAATVYAVTSERVVIVSGLFMRCVKSLSIDTITDVSLTERGEGAGTITFGPVPPFYWWYGGAGWPGFGHQAVPRFELAADARQVYEIIRGGQRAAKRQAEPGPAADRGGVS